VALYDGTNTTRARRLWVKEYLEKNLESFDVLQFSILRKKFYFKKVDLGGEHL